ncbi:hypothetical protein A6I77_18650 [Achromobacter xylosoxidans]|nr:hypothetical protein A6I77_18650 [Achromobacter xylosoxidans]
MRGQILAPRASEGGGFLRWLPRLLLPALAAVLFGGCASTAGQARLTAPAPAGIADPGPVTVPASWTAAATPMPRLFSHRLLAPPLQLVQIAFSAETPTVLAAMQRFAAAAPSALEARGLLRARTLIEPDSGWLTLIARAQGVDWVFGLQFSADGGGLLTLRLRTAGAGNIDNPRPQEMDVHIATLAALAPGLLAD